MSQQFTDQQREFLLAAFDCYRHFRFYGNTSLQIPAILTSKQRGSTLRHLIAEGYIAVKARRAGIYRFTSAGLALGEQMYAEMGLDFNLIYQSADDEPVASLPARPSSVNTSTMDAFLGTAFRLAVDRAVGWHCLLCADGKMITDRFTHWRWHQRLADTVTAIDWMTPVAAEGDQT